MTVIHYNFWWWFFHVFLYVAPLIFLGMMLETEEGERFVLRVWDNMLNFFDNIIDKFIKK